MRRMTVEYPIEPLLALGLDILLKEVRSIEMLEMLHLDAVAGRKMGVFRVTVRDDFCPDRVPHPFGDIKMTILESKGKEHMVLIDAQGDASSITDVSSFPEGLIFARPTYISEAGMVLSIIATDDKLRRILDFLSYLGPPLRVSMAPAQYQSSDLLSLLTPMQRKAMDAAVQGGYYEIPRRLDGQGLADLLGVSKATALHHLRQGEGRLIRNVFNGS